MAFLVSSSLSSVITSSSSIANTFQLCASKQRTKAEERKKAVQKKKKTTKKKNEVCWGGCFGARDDERVGFGARDDERVGVVVETSQSLLLSKSSWLLLLLSSFTSSLSSSFSRYEKKGTSDDGDGEERERERGRLRLAGRSNPNEIFTSLTERESRLLLHRRLADIESFNVHDSKTFSRGSRERYRSERTHEF